MPASTATSRSPFPSPRDDNDDDNDNAFVRDARPASLYKPPQNGLFDHLYHTTPPPPPPSHSSPYLRPTAIQTFPLGRTTCRCVRPHHLKLTPHTYIQPAPVPKPLKMHSPAAFVSVPYVVPNAAASNAASGMPASRPTSSQHGARASTFLACETAARHRRRNAVRSGVRRVALMPTCMSVTTPPSPLPPPTDRGRSMSGNSSTPVRQPYEQQQQPQNIGTESTSMESILDDELSPNNHNGNWHTVATTAIAAAMTSQAEHPNAVYIPVQLHFPSAAATDAAPFSDQLPACLHGLRLLRMGPGIFDGLSHSDGQPFAVGHWFDGLCLLHNFEFSSQSSSSAPTLRYSSRSLTEHVERTIRATPRWRWIEMSFGSPPLLLPTGDGGVNGNENGTGGHERSWVRKIADAVLASVWPVKDPVTNQAPMPNIPVLLQHVGSKGLSARSDGAIGMQVLLNGDEHDDTTGTLKDGAIEPGQFFTLGDIDPRLKGFFAASHGGIDGTTGDMFDFVFGLDDLDKRGEVEYTVFHLPASSATGPKTCTPTPPVDKQPGPGKVLASFRASPVYMHSVGLTPTFVIVTLWPMVLRPLRFLFERAMTRAMMFDRRLDTEFRLVRRDTGELAARVIADAAFVFHIANAFDIVADSNVGNADDRVKAVGLDVCWFADGNAIVNAMSMRSMRNATKKTDFPAGKLVRYTLPVRPAPGDDAAGMSMAKALTKTLYDGYVELPCVAPMAVHDPGYRYVYGVAHEDAVFDSVVKIDVSRGEVVGRWSCGDGEESSNDENSDEDATAKTGDHGVVGEPVFVPNVGVSTAGTAGTEEDGGVLLVVTVERATREETEKGGNENEKEWKSRLVVLCAKHMRLIASAGIPRVVPLGYHGSVVRQ